jgi:hypothetical protein
MKECCDPTYVTAMISKDIAQHALKMKRMTILVML